jgi:hypothetical protein
MNMANILGQQNGYAGLAAGMNNPLGNFGTASNFGSFGSNISQQSTAALLQQLIAQHNGGIMADNNQAGAPNAANEDCSGDYNLTSGNKRRIDVVNSGGGSDEDDRPEKKQMVAL